MSVRLSELTVFAGGNNTGKSNVLAALHLFFRDETAPGRPLSFTTDYPLFLMKGRQRKQTRIQLSFSLPPNFTYRQRLEDVEKLLGRSFSIAKVWTPSAASPEYVLLREGEPERVLKDEEARRVRQFLDLVEVRWVPNRIGPIEVLGAQQSALRAFIARAVGPSSGKSVFERLQKVADSLGESIDSSFTGLATSVDRVRLEAPTNVKQLALALNYSVTHGGLRLADIQQGSGIQSFLMFAVLRVADRAHFGNQFGWRQLSLWLVEEPETSMHQDLEARIAALLREIALDHEGRHQIICTSHSQVVAESATDCYLLQFVGPGDRKGTDCRTLNEDERADALATAGVSGYVVPFLRHPLEPILLVEGSNDRPIVEKAWRLLHPDLRVRVLAVTELNYIVNRDVGGVAAMAKLLAECEQHLKVRSRRAPIVALVDWEQTDKEVSGVERAIRAHPTSKMLRYPAAEANPNIDEAVRGIERFMPTAMLLAHQALLKSGGLMKVPATGKYRYTKQDLDPRFKSAVARNFSESATVDDCVYLRPTLDRAAGLIRTARG